MEDKEIKGRLVNIIGEISLLDLSNEIVTSFNQNLVWTNTLPIDKFTEQLDVSLNTIRKTMLSCLYRQTKNENEGDNIMSDIQFNYVEQGWQCPICKRVMSPRQDYCIFCAKQESTISTAGLSTDVDWVKYQSKSFSEDKK